MSVEAIEPNPTGVIDSVERQAPTEPVVPADCWVRNNAPARYERLGLSRSERAIGNRILEEAAPDCVTVDSCADCVVPAQRLHSDLLRATSR